jgi:glucokinase
LSAAKDPIHGLVGDVGGTNARFALAHIEGGKVRVEDPISYKAADYPTGDEAVEAYVAQLDPALRPRFAVVAAAGPIDDGAVTFTNNTAWKFSENGLAKAGGFARARLINDFTAQALAIDHLTDGDVRRVGPAGSPPARGTAAILGPGTGFGVAARVDDGETRATLTSEGGHMGLAAEDALEIEVLRRLTLAHGRVSVERVVSGPGLLNLYRTLADIKGEPATIQAPDQITKAALAGEPLAELALQRFCAFLGAVAGNFALAYGARKGVYISGGIAPDIFDFLANSDFRARFEAKGRMSDYVKAIPTFVVTQPHAALIGAASLLPTLEAAA